MRSFAHLFLGRSDVYGWYGNIEASAPTERGKLASIAKTIEAPLTPEIYEAHLAGRDRMGIVPIMLSGDVCWSVIDVDHYQVEGLHEKIAKAIKSNKCPGVVTKSKSGGAHIWFFYDEPVPADSAIKYTKNWITKLSLPKFGDHVEVFPMQKNMDVSKKGSWVNLPYFGEHAHALNETGKGTLSLEQFLALANANLIAPFDVMRVNVVEGQQEPPCVGFMESQGVHEGDRNNSVKQFAVYALKRWPDDWAEKVREFAETKVTPALSKADLEYLIKCHKPEHQYMCDRFTDICDKAGCRKAKYGIRGGVTDVGITGLEKIDSDDPLYLVEIGEKSVQVDGPTLWSYNLLRQQIMIHMNVILPSMKQYEWETLLDAILQSIKITKADDAQMAERISQEFIKWSGAKATSIGEISDNINKGQAHYDGEYLIFKGADFMTVVEKTTNIRLNRNQMWLYMREQGAIHDEVKIKGRKVQIWKYPVGDAPWFDPEKGGRL